MLIKLIAFQTEGGSFESLLLPANDTYTRDLVGEWADVGALTVCVDLDIPSGGCYVVCVFCSNQDEPYIYVGDTLKALQCSVVATEGLTIHDIVDAAVWLC